MKYEICGIIKDEHLFLKEWIDYHLNIGFQKITLFEDYGSKSHSEITKNYFNVELIPLVGNQLGIKDYHSSATQMAAYNYYFRKCKKEHNAEWVLFTDVDEFLRFQDGYNLDKLTDEFKDYAGIWLSWRLYSSNGHIKRPKGNVIDNYTKPLDSTIAVDNAEQWKFKSFVNISKAESFYQIHAIKGGVHTNYNDDLHSSQCWDKAWLNHYFCKSWEDYCERMQRRGNMSNNYRCYDAFFRCNPDLLPRKEEMIESIRYKHNKCCMWISRDLKLISGGNLAAIEELKKFV